MSRCDCPPYDCAGRVRQSLAGDREAGDELFRKFTPLVAATVNQTLGSRFRDHREEVQQAALARLFWKLQTWRGRCPFCKWVPVVARRLAIDYKRAWSRRPDIRQLAPGQKVVDRRPPDSHIDLRECIQRVYEQLPEHWRRVYDLTVQGLSREEAARAAGQSVRTIQSWLSEIRARLRPCLEE
jgi:RNA polymerase sigma factor (sigma-70 family)